MSNLVVFGLTTTVILSLLGLIFKKSKILGIIQIVWIVLLMGLNTGGGDYAGNQAIFELSDFGFSGIFSGDLYKILCSIFKTNNFDFVLTNFIFSVFSILVLYVVARKHTKNKNLVFSLFMIFPMFDFIMQKRAFLALPFDLLALEMLFSDIKGKYLYSVLITAIASQIHSSSFFFFLIILFYFIYEKTGDEKKFNRIVVGIIAIILLSLAVVPEFASKFFSEGRISLYFSEGTISFSSAIAWIGIHLSFVMLQRLLPRFSVKKLTENEEKYEKVVSVINLVSLILTPLYFYESAFFRLFKVILFLNYICLANRAKYGLNKKVFLNTSLFVLYILFIFMLLYIWTGYGFETLIEPLFENNMFISWWMGV